jgi:hypothetical protein
MTDQQSPVAVLRADRQVIERAARAVRDLAISGGYAGLREPARAFALALVLDELARHVRYLDDDLRGQVVAACRQVAGKV